MNQTSARESFSINYKKLFGFEFPHLDATEMYFRELENEHLETIKTALIHILFNRKTFHKFRLLGLFHIVAIDGVNLHSYNYEPFKNCPYKKTENKTSWSVNAVEAKLVYCNGFAISLATEFILNSDGHKKQDCEQNAAIRLCNNIKSRFPCLPICIAADGLYTSERIFDLCKRFNWKYLITLKNDSLGSVWAEIRVERLLQRKNNLCQQTVYAHKWITKQWLFVKDIPYHKKFKLTYIELHLSTYNKKKHCKDELRFAYLTNLDASKSNIAAICDGARLRWNIENQGFNEQKNRGYALKHKFSRTRLIAIQNYYQCLQIAHIIAQLSVKCQLIKKLKGRLTEKFLWEQMVNFITEGKLSLSEIELCLQRICQFRY